MQTGSHECQNPAPGPPNAPGGRIGVRDDKKLQTRERLERAALELFGLHGYEATTVGQVAARAGVSARTAFRYFPTKADLVFGDAEANLRQLRSALGTQDGGLPAFAAVRAALGEFSRHIDRPINAERARLIAANPVLAARALKEREVWADAVADELGRRRGLDAPEGRDRLGGLLVIAILWSAVQEWSQAGDSAGGLREAIDRTAMTAADILHPSAGQD